MRHMLVRVTLFCRGSDTYLPMNYVNLIAQQEYYRNSQIELAFFAMSYCGHSKGGKYFELTLRIAAILTMYQQLLEAVLV